MQNSDFLLETKMCLPETFCLYYTLKDFVNHFVVTHSITEIVRHTTTNESLAMPSNIIIGVIFCFHCCLLCVIVVMNVKSKVSHLNETFSVCVLLSLEGLLGSWLW